MGKQFPPLDPATIGKAFADGRAYRHLEAECAKRSPLHAPRHYRIESPVSKLEWAFVCIVFAAMCAMIVSL